MTTQTERDQADEQAQQLQKALWARLAAFNKLPDGNERSIALDALIDDGERLLDAERQASAADGRLERAQLKLRATGVQREARLRAVAPLAVGASFVILILTGLIALWWLLLAVPLTGIGLVDIARPVQPTASAIEAREIGGRIGVAAGVLAGLALIPFPWIAATVVLLVLAGCTTIFAATALLGDGSFLANDHGGSR